MASLRRGHGLCFGMLADPAALYNAYASRDPRFDGVFYIGVTSTGIYCRPVCTARTPKAANCRFFANAESAEQASFRPCLRCRPELAPGNAPVDDANRIAKLVASRIEEGMLDNGEGLETIARKFGWSSRQIRRIIRKQLGVSPIQLVQTRRLLLAKQLLTETALPVTEIAFASGFGSLRRFNDAFGSRYGMPPTRLRRMASGAMARSAPDETLTLQLGYRPPFDWVALLEFLRVRAMKGVEHVEANSYSRTLRIGRCTGYVTVRNAPEQRAILVQLTHSLTPVIPALLGKVRDTFDLSARPDVIAAQLSLDPLLAASVALRPGLRVPGAFDFFELAVRSILGQQISVAAATTLAGRYVHAFGECYETANGSLTHLTPAAERVARLRVDDIASLGVIRARAAAIIALAIGIVEGRFGLHASTDAETIIERLIAVPGIGAWTAQYIAMRALRWPDAFPKEDVVVRRALGGVTAARADQLSQPWRPWRSYATLHLWQGGATPRA